MTKSKWNDLGVNHVLYGKGNKFFVSYNPNTFSLGLSMFRGDTVNETALVIDDKYYILNGDFRKEYEKLVPKGQKACMDFFNKNADKKSSWSN